MINLYQTLLSSGVTQLSLNSHLSKVIHLIYSDASFGEKGISPFKDKITQEQVKIAIHNSNIIEPLLPYKDAETFLENYMHFCFQNDLHKDHVGQLWKSFYASCNQRFDSLLSDSKNQSDHYYARWHRIFGLDAASVFVALKDDDRYNWEKIFSTRILTRSKVEAYSSLDNIIMSANLSRFSDKMISFVEDTDFSKRRGSSARKEIYFSLIRSGKLTKKIARKIRSDGSEEASLDSIKVLLDNSYLYPNFSDLASQVTDSNYHSVASYLASNLPINTLAFLAGTKWNDIRATVVNRMTKHQDGDKNA